MKTKVVLWPRQAANGEFPLKLRISDGDKTQYKPLGVTIPKSKWNDTKGELRGVRPSDSQEYKDYLSLRTLIKSKESIYQDKITSLAKEGRNVTIDQLVNLVENPVRKTTVFSYFDDVINKFKTANNLGQASVYKSTKDSVKAFTKGDVMFSDIDLKWLNDYENYLRKNGLKDTTISIYFRTLRSLYNMAVGEKCAKQTDYPFGKKNDNTVFTVSKFEDKTRKRAISKEDLQKIIDANLPVNLQFAREIFLFSYYAAGINFNDIAKLTWRNYDGEQLSYTRTKTGCEIETLLVSYPKSIIQKYRFNSGMDSDNYIFPILHKEIHRTPMQIKNRIHKLLGQVNQALKEIGTMTGIKENLSTYSSRHSFITHMAQSNQVSPYNLQNMVGHKDIQTTMIYFKKPDQGVLNELMKNVMGA